MRVTEDESAQRFAAVSDRFARARDRCGAGELRFRFADHDVRLRVAGGALTDALHAPFAHLAANDGEGAPQLAIDLWDVTESGVAQPPAELAHPSGSSWDLGDSLLAMSADARFISHAARRSIAWLDRRDGRITGWYADAADLSLHQRGKPLQTLLALWARDRGLHAVHAGLVGRSGRGVLLPGRSGSGKSTATLASLQDGYTYIGDDWIALDRRADGTHVGHGLYGTACLESQHAEHFARLHPQTVAANGAPEPKSVLLLSQTVPERLARSVPLCALALPQVVDRVETRVRPASRRDALLTIVPSSIFTMSPRGGRGDAQRMIDLVEQLPAYWLEIGRDMRQIPRRIDDILRDVDAS